MKKNLFLFLSFLVPKIRVNRLVDIKLFSTFAHTQSAATASYYPDLLSLMINSLSFTHLFKGKKTYLLAGLLSLSAISFSQEATDVGQVEKNTIKRADKQWRRAHLGKAHLTRALALYKKAFSIDPKNSYINYQIGTLYYGSDSEKIKALPYFRNAIRYSSPHRHDTIIDAYYYMGYCYMLNEQYDSSAISFKKYESHLRNVNANKQAFTEIDRNYLTCRMAPALLARTPDSASYFINGKIQHLFVSNIGSTINTPYSEYPSRYNEQDSTLLYISHCPASKKGKIDRSTGQYYEDTYLSKRHNGQWLSPRLLLLVHPELVAKKPKKKSIILWEDGKTLFIYYYGSILQSNKVNNRWNKPRNLSEHTKKLKDLFISYVFLSADSSRLLLVAEEKGNYGGTDLYMCKKNIDGNWSEPENLGPTINSSEDENAPFLMPDNKTLYFSSKGHGGLGGYDIFVSHYDGGQWSIPQNLGAPINSPADDTYFSYDKGEGYFSSSRIGGYGDMDIYFFSYINTNRNRPKKEIWIPDDKTQYFSLKRQKGVVGYDNFASHYDSARWSTPQNLGASIDSVSDSSCFSYYEKNKGYFYLSLLYGYSDINIYSSTIIYDKYGVPESKIGASLLMSSTDTTYFSLKKRDSSGYEMFVSYFDTGKWSTPENIGAPVSVDTGHTYFTYRNKDQRYFYLSRISGFGNMDIYSYSLINSMDTAMPSQVDSTLSANTEYNIKDTITDRKKSELFDKSLSIGSSIVLKNVFFETGKYDLTPKSQVELDKLISFLENNPTIKIEISGHTDNTGDPGGNIILSENRAKSVYTYLIAHLIDGGRLTYKGYGDAMPIATNSTPEGRALNRGTEVRITAK